MDAAWNEGPLLYFAFARCANNFHPAEDHVYADESANEKFDVHLPGNDFRDGDEFRFRASALLDFQ